MIRVTRRFEPLVSALRRAVTEAPGEAPAALRAAACEGAVKDPVYARYVAKVRAHAYRVTDADIAELRAAGASDEAIFEVTVAAALGEGLRRLRIGLRLLGQEL